jgi:hypothetical protein
MKIQIKLATPCNKNEHKKDAKNNAELLIKWTKTIWKIFEVSLKRGQSGLLVPNS